MSIRRGTREFVVGAVAGAVLTLNIGIGWAGTAYGSEYDFGPINGHSFYNFAWVSDTSSMCDSGHVCSATVISTQSGGTVSAGGMGAYNTLYKNGAVCKVSGWIYNDRTLSGMSAQAHPGCNGGTYGSQGQTAVWNGTSYNTQYTFVTPAITYSP